MSAQIARLTAALEGRYSIQRQIGEGGMAVVYLADDLRHERKVALKVLKPDLAAAVGAGRFLAEIRTTANLQHPHILPLFDSGEADSFLFYVMPYVEGESLRERLNREGQLPVDESVRIASLVAAALDHAHSHGVVHRDIKPENILLQPDGPAISDFGIALAAGSVDGGRLTETGLIVGTLHYMSPEQAAGEVDVGAAADIYALGCVLYEMLAGEPPHTGNTPQAVLADILTGKLRAVSELRRTVPRNVSAAIAKAAEPVPADRFRSAREFTAALADERFRYGEVAGRSWNRVAGWPGAALLLGIFVGGTAVALRDRGPMPEPVVFLEAPPAATHFLEAPVPSPDGRYLAMRVTEPDGEAKLWVRALVAEHARALAGTEGATIMFWSPDSRELAYHAGGRLRRARIDGSGDRLVATLPVGAGVWTTDDELIVSSRDRIIRIPAAGGTPQVIVEGFQYRDLDFVPTGSHLLVRQFGAETGIHSVHLPSGNRRLLIPGAQGRVRYVAPDILVYVEGRVLLAQRFRASDMNLVGDPVPVAHEIASTFFAGSTAGILSFIRGAQETNRLIWFDRQGDIVAQAAPVGVYTEVYLSPQGTRMMYARSDPETGNVDLWVQDATGSAPPIRLTTDPDIDHLAAFSPDGREVAWEAHAGGALNLVRRPVDGSAPESLVRPWGRAGGVVDWSPDGRFILYSSDDGPSSHNLWAVPLHEDADPYPLIESAFSNVEGRFSPDGRWLAYSSNASGQHEIYLQRLDGMGPVSGPQRVSEGGGRQPQWRGDGTELLYVSGGRLMVVDTRLDQDRPAGTARELFDIGVLPPRNGYAVTPDGQRIVAIAAEETRTREPAVVILDWARILDR